MKVSVFTSSYNHRRFLRQAIESVLNQTYRDFEYLLIDDGSTDDSYKIMSEYTIDKRVTAIQVEKQSNIGVVLNKGINILSGDYWSWLPADDYWATNLLEEKIKFAEQCPNAVIYDDFFIVDEWGGGVGQVDIKQMTTQEFNKEVWVNSPIGFTGIFIPMGVFKTQGIYFPEHLDFSEDFYWMIDATIHGVPFLHIPKRLHYKRTHPNSMTSQRYSDIIANIPKIREELRNKL